MFPETFTPADKDLLSQPRLHTTKSEAQQKEGPCSLLGPCSKDCPCSFSLKKVFLGFFEI